MPQKTMHGARAEVGIVDPNTGQARIIGIFNNFSYNLAFGVQAAFILGRYSAAELATTSAEPVAVTAQGFKVVDFGFFKEGHITNVRDLLFQEYITIAVFDRQNPAARPVTIRGCLPTGHSATVSAKQLMEGTNTYLGLLMDEDDTQNTEAPDAADLPG